MTQTSNNNNSSKQKETQITSQFSFLTDGVTFLLWPIIIVAQKKETISKSKEKNLLTSPSYNASRMNSGSTQNFLISFNTKNNNGNNNNRNNDNNNNNNNDYNSKKTTLQTPTTDYENDNYSKNNNNNNNNTTLFETFCGGRSYPSPFSLARWTFFFQAGYEQGQISFQGGIKCSFVRLWIHARRERPHLRQINERQHHFRNAISHSSHVLCQA